jgi:hypothetical protein
MHQKEIAFIETALLRQRVTVRRTLRGHLVFRKDGQTIGFLHAEGGLHDLERALFLMKEMGAITWPPDW